MGLPEGVSLGPYVILAPLGAGGMGEVYKARDSRLGREVALKVLPDDATGDAERLRRLDLEARAASSLNHPNVVAVHDVGEASLPDRADPVRYIVMELLTGETLLEVLGKGPLKLRPFLELAVPLAEGLAAAHDAGLVHRDLKPSNVFVTETGHVKILDFGLAKVLAPRDDRSSVTTGSLTQPGEVLGTVGYMSPEQVRGETATPASDQFALGCVFYEMLTGRPPFRRGSKAETLTAILRDDPQPIEERDSTVPAPVRWVVDRCLAKSPRSRYVSTRDLARELATLRDHASDLSSRAFKGPRPLRIVPSFATSSAVAAAAVGLLAVLFFLVRERPSDPPVFRRLTWQRGTVVSARFAPDGQTVLYGASWDGKPPAIFLKRAESPDAVPLDLPAARLLAVSGSGELAIQLDPRFAHFEVTRGTLARAALSGGTPRELADDVDQADFAPDGALVVARDAGGKGRIESPLGTVLYETSGHVSYPRFSPRGDLVAFVDHPFAWDDRGSIAIVDRKGVRKVLSREFESVQGLSWSPKGDEIWFTAAVSGASRSLWGVALSGRQRAILRVPGDLRMQDVTRTGRILLTRGDPRFAIRWLLPGETREREVSWFGWSSPADISADGKTLVFMDAGEPSGANYAVCISRAGAAPVKLGEGNAGALSPDGKWVLSRLPRSGTPVFLLPTGSGESRHVETNGLAVCIGGPCSSAWLPDGKRVVLLGREEGHALNRLFVQELGDGAAPTAISPEGVGGAIAVSPDGTRVAATDRDGRLMLYPVAGGEARTARGAVSGDAPVEWAADGRSLFVRQTSNAHDAPARLFRLNLETGARVLWKELFPEDPAGFVTADQVRVTPDGRSYAYNYYRLLSDLYLVEGVR